MLALDLPTEPYWLDLPRRVRVEIRPVTTAVMAAAQAAAARRLAAIRLPRALRREGAHAFAVLEGDDRIFAEVAALQAKETNSAMGNAQVQPGGN